MNPPELWLERLAEAVSSPAESYDPLPPLGCHHWYDQANDRWEVSLFYASTEIHGGPKDGHQVPARFFHDLEKLRGIFDQVDEFVWQPLPIDESDELGPHISIVGIYEGHRVCVQFLAKSPQRFKAGRVADVNSGEFHNIW